MNEQPLSIIIPTFNEQNNLSRLLPYLENCTKGSEVDIIVCDAAASKDEIKLVCERHQVRYLRAKATQRSIQLNLGATIATGDVLLFLHADVYPPGDFYQQIQKSINEGYGIGFFSYRFDSPELMLRINSFLTRFDHLFAGGGDQCHFFQKDTFFKLGGYNENYVIMEDFELMRRIRRTNLSYKIIQSQARVSARKYKSNSYWWVNLVNLYLFIKFVNMAQPEKLAQLYGKLLNK